MEQTQYIIRGGIEGRERLRLLSRVMRPTSVALLEGMGSHQGKACLDVGTGGGEMAVEIGRLIGTLGRVVALDRDEVKLDLARKEADQGQITNVQFQKLDVELEQLPGVGLDLVYTRFLLTHLKDPLATLTKMFHVLRLGGDLVVEDVDFSGHFCYPSCPAFQRYTELYAEMLRRAGGDANIGQRLPSLVMAAGFRDVWMNVVQPAGMDGDVKHIAALTLANIADALIGADLATRAELDALIAELQRVALDQQTVMSLPRVVQVRCKRPK